MQNQRSSKDKMTEDPAPEPAEKHVSDPSSCCLICGKPSPQKICEHCKIVVQAEAVAKKRKTEKEGGGPPTSPR